MEMLWHLTAREAPQGDIGKLTNESIAICIEYEEDPDALIAVLLECGWLDESNEHRLVIHDWSEHSDDTVDNKLARAGKCYADGMMPRMKKLSTKERDFLCGKFGWSDDGDPQNAFLQHERPLPGPVPEPVIGTPPLSVREAAVPNHSPEAGAELAQAVALLDKLAIPSDLGTKHVVADAIHQHSKEVGSAERAYQEILTAAMAAKQRGVTINRFWFTDQKYRKQQHKEVSNGTLRSATHARVSANKQAVADALARRGIDPSRLAGFADGRALPQPGPGGLDGGVLVGL
jgi:hypothetical protein